MKLMTERIENKKLPEEVLAEALLTTFRPFAARVWKKAPNRQIICLFQSLPLAVVKPRLCLVADDKTLWLPENRIQDNFFNPVTEYLPAGLQSMKLRGGGEGSALLTVYVPMVVFFIQIFSAKVIRRAQRHKILQFKTAFLSLPQTKTAALGVEAGFGVDWMKDWVLRPPTVNGDVTMMEMAKFSFCPLGSIPMVEGGKSKTKSL